MPHPRTHLQTGTPAPSAGDPAWQEWSHAWTRHIPLLTGRTDLTVTVAPGAGGGAPACFYPDTARIEVDATHIGAPDVANPRRPGHKRLVPTAYGLLVHEAAHAAHSLWRTPPGTPPVVAAVADLLEESRIEYRQRTRRRGDRRWLRHTVTALVSPDDAPVDDPWHAAHLAGLLLARVDARIVTAKDIKGVRAAVTAILGRKRLLQLRDVWRQAHVTDDSDADAMVDLAWRWCRTLGIDPHQQPQPPAPDPGVFAGRLAQALTDYLAHAGGFTPAEYRARQITARHSAPASWTRRDPTDAERAAARHLADRLRRARTLQPEPDTRPSLIPPGRLRTRHAITAQAQIAAGTIPTATPWQRRTTLPPPKPTLHLAVIVDVSFSMHPYAAPMSSAGWILAHAARSSDAVTATIAFGSTVTLLIGPRQRPTHVQDMHTFGGSSTFIDAVKLADDLLQLRQPGRLRMLAVVSDGDLDNIAPAQRLVSTLHRTGCAVLWLRPADGRAHLHRHHHRPHQRPGTGHRPHRRRRRRLPRAGLTPSPARSPPSRAPADAGHGPWPRVPARPAPTRVAFPRTAFSRLPGYPRTPGTAARPCPGPHPHISGDTVSDTHRLPITSPADLLTAVPYLLGFHPTDSLVIVGLAGTRVAVASRTDLPASPDLVGWADDVMPQQLRMLHHASVTTAIVIGYGPASLVTPVLDTLTPRLRAATIDVFDALRVTGRRYYSYLCQNPHCCPIDGRPFDPDRSNLTLHAIVAGHTALPDRQALVATIAPIDGPARAAVTRATYRARARRRALTTDGGRDALIRAGEDIVRQTFARYAADQVLTDDELAWLTVLLPITAIRDAAWRATDSQPWHVAMWSDITRRAQPGLAAPPASLLAFAAWRSGAGALAGVAVDRALQADPTYSLAQLIDRALREGLPPSVLDGWPDQGFPTTP